MRFLRGQFFSRLFARFRFWRSDRHAVKAVAAPTVLDFASVAASIHREVTSTGVRVFSLCGCCGARLQASATLCEECAQKKRPARPF
jgi:hypothetical protein